MTEEEYKKELKALTDYFENKKNQIIKNYLQSNDPYKIGDIIKDHIGFLMISHVKYRLWQSDPQRVYYGIELHADGKTPKAKQEKRGVWQNNIIKQ